ncbi:response regulator transcription factor [Marinimicrobium sp. ABcell2]|uniref:response regulator transcription factor n=1 Tax=Marinimicrobium sp. ABcell2 TaxID=3069751 RepID=UPI0027B54463|nr:response regulator transcription factor [Marinimicrobium sp. ABcell2]MDQ2077006.1 response regulator transcription factor [Marinimicrobium sp. ABcell2]
MGDLKINSAPEVLLVEDDRDLAGNIIDYLALVGIECDYCDSAERASSLLESNRYDVIVLDIQLPGINGFDWCAGLRAKSLDTPVLMLTARDTLADKLTGFDSGAEDYVVKPFDLIELEARLRVLHRRFNRLPAVSRELTVADLRMNTDTHSVKRGDTPLKLTRVGWQLLRELMQQSPRVVTKENLEHLLWPDKPANSEALKSHIYSLRKAVDEGHELKLIHTIRGVGLCLKPD